jgi:hypothetical protein
MWQKIDTAPQDQRSILAVHENSKIMAVCWRNQVGGTLWLRHGESANGGTGWRPTHWMPLPEPPNAA